MTEKNIQTRHIQKHGVERVWKKAKSFVPKKGELIIYDIDDNYSYERFKIGDGTTRVGDLPFAILPPNWSQSNETAIDYIKNKPFGDNSDGTVTKIDNKYLEILESLKDVNELLPSTTGTTQYDGNFGVYAISVLTTEEINNYWHVVNGMEIEGNVIVEFDGEAYSCAPQRIASLGNIVAIGNCTVWGGTNNGEPFVITIMNFKSANGNIEPCFVVAALTDTAPTQHTARVYQKMPERYVIKNEYLPFDAIAAYIDNYIDEALGGDY